MEDFNKKIDEALVGSAVESDEALSEQLEGGPITPEEQEVADFMFEEAELASGVVVEEEVSDDTTSTKPRKRWKEKLSAFLLASNVLSYMAMATEAEGGTRRHHPDDSWRFRQAGRRIGFAIQTAERQVANNEYREIVQKIRFHQGELRKADAAYRRALLDAPSPERDRYLAELHETIVFHEKEARHADYELRNFELKEGLRREGVGILRDLLAGR